MKSVIDELLDLPAFEHSSLASERFLASFRETAEVHYGANKIFRSFWQEAGLRPSDIQSENDLIRVPPLMINIFKEWDLWTGNQSEIVLTLTSSGTSGQKSQIFLNKSSLSHVKRLAYRVHQDLGITSDNKFNYLCFTYDPRVAKDLGTAFTDELLTSFTGVHKLYYAFQWSSTKNDFEFNVAGCLEFLKYCESDWKNNGVAVRILGFPAFLYQLMVDHHLQLNLGDQSWVQTGGGWKAKAHQEIQKDFFRQRIEDQLGIAKHQVRDLYGLVEHGIPYVDCAFGNLHIPEYARVFVRNPYDLSFAAKGEKGLLQLLCTYNTSYPAMSLLTTDWGRVGDCACGLGTSVLELLGRAGSVDQHGGCALKALEIFKKRDSGL